MSRWVVFDVWLNLSIVARWVLMFPFGKHIVLHVYRLCGAFHHPNVKCWEERTASPVNHCIYQTLPVISTVASGDLCSSEQMWIVLDQGRNGPGLPFEVLKLCSSSCPSTGLLALCCSLFLKCCLHADSFWDFIFYFLFLLFCLFLHACAFISSFSSVRLCGFSCALLEWRVCSKANNGADSLWGNKPAQGTPQTPQEHWCLSLSLLYLLSIKNSCFLSIASQRYLQTQHFFLFFSFFFPS